MKIIKEMEQGLLLNHFGLAGKFYLTVTVMAFFSLDNPNIAQNEQEMWPFVQSELGKDAILDMAMPKMKGEALVWGSCFTSNGKPRAAAQVSFQVGDMKKTLNVFGDRFWKRAGGTLYVITDPELFTQMPISYDRAFGGQGFDRNPLGRGFAPTLSADGQEFYPLPNVELAEKLIGSPMDRPDPAGFAPLDFTWPQRSKKTGTYDKQWLEERWPYYPDDMDWTYFNAAPDDQQADNFFKGGESIVIRNMHKTKPLLESRIPALRQRCFLNQLEDLKKKDGDRIFKEVKTRIDTLWLFPNAEKGIAIFRGSTEVADDEALDALHLYIATESLGEKPKSLEHYHEEFLKRIDRSVAADIAGPMAAAKKKLEAAAQRLQDLPLEINDAIARNLGEAPKPVRTPHETIANSLGIIDQAQGRLNDAEKRLLEMKANYGHLMKIDLSGFSAAREQFGGAKEKLANMALMVENVKSQSRANLSLMEAQTQKSLSGINPAILKKSQFDPENFFAAFKDGQTDPWHSSGMRFIEQCRDHLLNHAGLLSALSSLGLRHYHVQRAWLGINPEDQHFSRSQWGLQPDGNSSENPDELVIPAGFIIPRFAGAKLDKITVRPFADDAKEPIVNKDFIMALMKNSKDAIVSGSQSKALVFSAGDKAFIRVADELEAIFLNQELGGICAVIAMKNQDIKPDDQTAVFLKKAPQFLVVIYQNEQKEANQSIKGWNKVYPQAEPLSLPTGQNLFEAKKAGVDLWQWVANALHPATAPDPETKPKEIDASKPGALAALVPVIDVEAIIKKVNDNLTCRMQPDLDTIEKTKKQMTDTVKKTLTERGINPDQALKTTETSMMKEANPYRAAKEKYAEKYADLRHGLAEKNLLKPDVEKNLLEAEKKNLAVLDHAAGQYEDGMSKLADARNKAKAGPPDWAKKLMSAAGIDPEDPAPMKNLNRDAVALRLQEGKSIAGKNLDRVDLSGLDLRGISFKRTHLQKAKLIGANLDGADFSDALANEADFSKASMKQANMSKGLFQKAKFIEASMEQCNLDGAVMTEADLSQANLSGASLEKTLLEKARLAKANLYNVRAKQGYFLSADVSGANFSGADVAKAVFLKANIDQANFSGGSVRGTIFIESKGSNLNFSGADMHNSRILNNSTMTDSNFINIKAARSSWLRSDFSGSDFRHSDIKRGLIEECNLTGTNLSGVTAGQARFTKSDLSDACLRQSNLFLGSLRKSKLVRSDLSGANLYGVEFFRTGVGETNFAQANMKMTKLHQRTDLLSEMKPPKK